MHIYTHSAFASSHTAKNMYGDIRKFRIMHAWEQWPPENPGMPYRLFYTKKS